MNPKIIVMTSLLFLSQIGNMVLADELIDQKLIRDRFYAVFNMSGSIDQEDKELASLLGKWERYIAAKKKYDHKAFLSAIMDYQKSYWDSLADLSSCLDKLSDQERQHKATDWFKAFEAKYGTAYLKKNRRAIVAALSAVHSKNSDAHCGARWKNALAREAFLFHGCKMYLSEFLSFYDGLDEKGKRKLNTRKEFVRTLLDDMEHGYIGVIHDPVSMLQPALDEYRAVNENKDIYQLIKNQPELNRPFDIDSVFKDLIAITTN